MTTKNLANFTFNQTVKILNEIRKKLKEKCCAVPQRKPAYDLKVILADWEIYPDSPLVDILRQIFHTGGGQEHFEDVERIRDSLLLHICLNEEIFELEEDIGYNVNPPSHSQISVQEVIADWNLSYHQGRALEYIYQSLFEYGDKQYDTLHEAAKILFHGVMLLRKKDKQKIQ